MQDILIYESGEGGELQLISNDLATVDSLANQVYIALFGGGDANWFGNDPDIAIDQNSTFETVLKSVALNASGLQKLENAARADLSYLNNFSVECSLIAPTKLKISVVISENVITFVWNENNIEIII